jgi:cytoskeleton protein RodZ
VSIGTDLTAARERAGMTIEQLSASTRIRSGLLTAMEADDFSRCGGNFYSRGHIRSIARVLEADPEALLAKYDETHPAVEVDRTRRETLDAKGPSLHPARPRWTLVVGAILVCLMGWGMIRLFTLPSDVEANASRSTPAVAVTTPTPKPTVTTPPVKPPVTPVKPVSNRVKVTLTATRDGSYVTLRNIRGLKLFQGLLGPGSSQTVVYPGTIRVQLGVPANVAIRINDKPAAPKAKRFTITPAGVVQKDK